MLYKKIKVAILLVCFSVVSSAGAALTCTNDFTFDWDTQSWPAPTNPTAGIGDYAADLSETFANIAGSGLSATIDISSDNTDGDLNRSFEFYVDNGNANQPAVAADVVGPGDTDGNGTNDNALQVIVDPVDDAFTVRTDMDVFLDVTLSEPVSELELVIADIDHNNTAQDRQDSVTITGNGGVVIPTLSAFNGSPNYTIAGNTATALLNNTNASPTPGAGEIPAADATVVVTFDEPITSFRIQYSDGIETAGNVGGLRGISMLGDFSFCRETDLSITKTDNEANYTPGQTFTYDIVVSNDANGIPADSSTFNDILPAWAQPTPPATTVAWSCLASGGAVCPATVTGSGDVIPTLPAGGTLTFTVSGTYSPNMADYP